MAPDQDRAEPKAFVTAKRIGVMAGELWQQAHYDGIRNGLEVAASYVDKVSDSFPTVGQVPGESVREMLTEMRDDIRLYALQIPDPSPMPDE